jgi:uncharacterized alkaline shock family protein YloU
MTENVKTELGEIKIHKSVIASITKEATKQVPGVIKIGTDLKTYLLGLLGKKDSVAISIEFNKNYEAIITIPIVTRYGYNIPEIASKVQENVKLAVENSTNITVRDINVNIQEIERVDNQ